MTIEPRQWAGWISGVLLLAFVLGRVAAQEVDTPLREETVDVNESSTMKIPLIVAHRGASAEAPENTLAAFNLGWRQDADAIEGDFYLSQDHQIVSLHDASTTRTSGVDWDVRKKTLAELRTLDVGRWKHLDFTDERIPTVAEVVQTIPPEKKLFLEIKDSPRLVPHLKQLATTDPKLMSLGKEQLVIIAFDAEVIAASKRELPDRSAFWLTSFKRDDQTGEIRPSIDEILSTLGRIGADGLDCQAAAHIDENFVAQIRAGGYQFHVWTVDDPAVAKRFADLGVDSITTNVPRLIRQQLILHAAHKNR